jgi:hypothetical protein
MGSITIAAINDAIATTLYTATGMRRKQSYDELTESLQPADLPLLQVYFESITCDPSGATDRTTFQAGVRHKVLTFHADVYGKIRGSGIGEEMKAALDICDAIVDVLENQDTNYFGLGLDDVRAFSWEANRAAFNYGKHTYIGFRFIITVHVY